MLQRLLALLRVFDDAYRDRSKQSTTWMELKKGSEKTFPLSWLDQSAFCYLASEAQTFPLLLSVTQ